MPEVYIQDINGAVADASNVTTPLDRYFREAWVLNGAVITEDLSVAKGIFRDKIREVRKPLLDAEDVVYMKALETDDASAKAASVARKQSLRDAPAAAAIDSASDIASLKAAWDSDLLGANPYA